MTSGRETDIGSGGRLLRDSHLGLENETLRENSRLILDLTLNVFGKTLTLILNSQKLSNSHSRLSTFNSRYFEKINIHSKKPRWSCTKYAFFCKAFKIIPSKIVATY